MTTATRTGRTRREAAAARAKVVEMVRGGATRRAAAAACGVHACTADAACRAAGMPPAGRTTRWTPEKDAWVLANPGLLHDAAATRERLGCGPAAARNRAKRLGGGPAPDPKTGMAAPGAGELAAARLLASLGRAAAGDMAAAMGERFAWDAELALRRSPLFEPDGRLWSLSGLGWAAIRDAGAGEPSGPCGPPSARMGRLRQARRPVHRSEAS